MPRPRRAEVCVTVVVNVSDARWSREPKEVLATYSLGSCIGVCAYDPVTKVGGMLHFQLPASSIDPARATQNPNMFADTGMNLLLKEMEAVGANKKRLKVHLAGGAQMLNDAGLFNIGRRNHAAIRKVLWAHGLFVDNEDIGGNTPRNLYLQIADGSVISKAQGTSKAL